MADAKTTTLALTLNELDELGEVHTQIQFIRSFIEILMQNPSFSALPAHNQVALDALFRFASDSENRLYAIYQRPR